MADIFGFEGSVQTTKLAHPGTFTVTAGGGRVGVAQDIQISFNQQIGQLYGMNTPDTVVTGGRLQGTIMIGQFISEKAPLHSLLSGATRVTGQGETITLNESRTGFGLTLKGCFFTNLGVSTNANGATVLENAQLTFHNLEAGGGGGNGGGGNNPPGAGAGGAITVAAGG